HTSLKIRAESLISRSACLGGTAVGSEFSGGGREGGVDIGTQQATRRIGLCPAAAHASFCTNPPVSDREKAQNPARAGRGNLRFQAICLIEKSSSQNRNRLWTAGSNEMPNGPGGKHSRELVEAGP